MVSRRRDRRYWFKLLRLGIVAVVAPVLILPMAFGAVTMWALTHPTCGADSRTPADSGLKYVDISIPSHLGGVYSGFFIPGTKDGTIIIPPTYAGGRSGMLREGDILAQDGYNVLLFESRMCSGVGAISLGYNEVDDVGDALAFLKNNNLGIHIDLTKIALHGFSSAGATAIMAGARYPEIAAVLAEGNYHNMDAYLGVGDSRNFWETLISFGARIMYWIVTGQPSSKLDPLGNVAKIPPRPLFLIHGTVEPSFYGGNLEYQAALAAAPNADIHLWKVPDAWHGGYIDVAGVDEYRRHVLPFYACALLNRCDDWKALWAGSN